MNSYEGRYVVIMVQPEYELVIVFDLKIELYLYVSISYIIENE